MSGERRVRHSTVLLIAGLFAFAAIPVWAQTITGDLSGDVTDRTGAVLPNVSVTAVNTGTNFSRTATTSENGNYRIPNLPIGEYKITATADGFKTAISTAEIRAGAIAQASFKMTVGQRAETVEVEGSAPLVELSPNENNYVDSLKIENVPLNGRDFNSLLAITPGVQRTPGGGFLAISINGSRTTSNNYFIDGLYNNDRYYGDSAINETGITGIPAVLFPPEAIEEMSVQETPSAEFGVKGGAPILLNMKSGTNSWHGSGTWVNHNGLGDADNYFANHNTDNCASPGECRPTPIHNNQMNATIGGPLIKDKAFFFLYYEGQRYISTAIASRIVPTPQDVSNAIADITAQGLTVDPVGQTLMNYFPTSSTGTFVQHSPTTASANGFGTKFDYKINSNNSFSARYIFGDSLQSAPPFAGLPPAASLPQNLFNSVAASRAQLAGISLTSNIGPNRILESRLGYTRFAQLLGINNKIDPKSLGIDTGPLGAADFGIPYVYMYHLGYGGYVGGVQGYPISTRPDASWDWSEHFSWVKGNHTIKFGGNFQRGISNSIRNNARTGLTVGYFSSYAPIPNAADPLQNDVEELLLGRADTANRDFGDTHRHIYQNSVGFYAQDDWKIKPRFTLNYGLRYELNGTIRDTQNREANFILPKGLIQVGQGINGINNVDYKDFGPHLGFSWDVFGNGRTALRAGYSLSFDVPNFGTFANPFTLAHSHTGVFDQTNLGVFSVSNTSDVAGGGGSGLPPNSPAASCYDPVAKAGDYICFDSAVSGPLFGPNPTGTPPFNAFAVVTNFKTPRYHNFNVSLQDELFRNNVLTVTYSGQRGRDLVIYHDLNASPIGSPSDSTPGQVCSSSADCTNSRPFHGLFVDPTSEADLFQHVIQASNQAHSQYDSLQASFNQRNWHGLDMQYNFTYSVCYDDNSVNRGGAGDYPQINNSNPVGSTAPAVANFKDSWGYCDHDVRLNFNVGGVYDVPQIHHLGERWGKGFQVSSIYTAISGRPFTAILSGNDSTGQGLVGNSIRAAWDGTPIHYNTRNPDNYISETYTAAGQADPCGNTNSGNGGLPVSPFYFPCGSSVGNSRRNQLRGPGLLQLDMAFSKATKIREHLDVELRWELYNVANRGNFYYLPNNILTTGGGFGQIPKTSDVASGNPVIAQGGPRNMNFVLKFIF